MEKAQQRTHSSHKHIGQSHKELSPEHVSEEVTFGHGDLEKGVPSSNRRRKGQEARPELGVFGEQPDDGRKAREEADNRWINRYIGGDQTVLRRLGLTNFC